MLLFSSNCPCDVRNRCQPVEPSPGVRCVFAHRDTRVTGRAGTVSIVVPVYNSAATLKELVGRLSSTAHQLGGDYEILLVDDGSSDDSWETVVALAAEHPRVRGLLLARNFGQHSALLAGIRAARYPITVTLDDDLQNPPEEIPKLLDRLRDGYDVVYGTPRHQQHGFWRNLGSRITKLALQSAMGADTARKVSAFRAFRTDIREAFADYRGPFPSIDVLLTWGTTSFGTVSVDHRPRLVGSSNYTFRRLVTHAVNMMTGFSVRPLQLASFIGFGFALFGVGVLVYAV